MECRIFENIFDQNYQYSISFFEIKFTIIRLYDRIDIYSMLKGYYFSKLIVIFERGLKAI